MEKEYKNNNLFVVLPSKVEEDKFVQKPKDITIVTKNEQNNYIDIFNNEEIFVFNRDELNADNKYINVFKNDYTTLTNYIFSLQTDHINNLDDYMKVVRSIKPEYTKEELEIIMEFLKEEIYNVDYTKTRKITTAKRRIRRKK